MANTIQIMNYAAPYPGNFMRSVRALESELGKSGASCLLLFPKGAQRLEWIERLQREGSKIFFGAGSILQDARLLASLISRYRIGILHSHFASAKMHLAIRLARLACPQVASVVHMHNHERARSSLKNAFKRTIVDADLYVGVSEHVCTDLIAKGYSPQKCLLVPNAVDFSRLDSSRPAGAVRSGGKKVLMFGFDFERKGVDIALEALSRYDPHHEMTLMIVLAANFEEVKARIEKLFQRVPEWVRLLPPNEDIASYYRMADVFISPSREEGLPYALIEAAYCGLRLVASDIGGQAALGIPNLIYFRSQDPRGLYEALQAATAEGQDARSIEEARDYVVSRFRLEKWVHDIVGIYARLSSGGGAWRRAPVVSSAR